MRTPRELDPERLTLHVFSAVAGTDPYAMRTFTRNNQDLWVRLFMDGTVSCDQVS